MPPLPDPDPPILAASYTGKAKKAMPSPSLDGLLLENITPAQEAYLSAGIPGVTAPYYEYPLGWGEWAPAYDGPEVFT